MKRLLIGTICEDISPDTEQNHIQGTMPGNSRVELQKAEFSKWERPDHAAYHSGTFYQKINSLLQVMS